MSLHTLVPTRRSNGPILLRRMTLHLARLGPSGGRRECPLSGATQTSMSGASDRRF
jgi:hypothetical protein